MAKQEKPKKDTTISVLQDIRDMLIPIHNLSRFYISEINKSMEEQKKRDDLAKTKTAEGEMKKLEIED